MIHRAPIDRVKNNITVVQAFLKQSTTNTIGRTARIIFGRSNLQTLFFSLPTVTVHTVGTGGECRTVALILVIRHSLSFARFPFLASWAALMM